MARTWSLFICSWVLRELVPFFNLIWLGMAENLQDPCVTRTGRVCMSYLCLRLILCVSSTAFPGFGENVISISTLSWDRSSCGNFSPRSGWGENWTYITAPFVYGENRIDVSPPYRAGKKALVLGHVWQELQIYVT